jgi:hypothetical protein
MKKHKKLFGAVCAVLLALGCTAKATTILDFGDSRDLGQVLFGIPSGDAARVTYVNHLVSMTPGTSDTFAGQTFNRTLASCGACTATSLPVINGGKGVTDINLGAGGFLYLFAKYDGPNAGSEVWYLGGLTGEISIPAQGLAGQKYGLSGWTLFGPGVAAPDGGATAALLGLSLAGLAGLRARFGRN